ncbi:MAG: DUF86 domain-containing protein [Chloroflexi bacterium]|nr:DUF86 domain-containing protein [Chloroflexota bacterium]
MKDDKLYIIHIKECIERVENYVGDGGKGAFMASGLIQDAVIRNLQTMAESTQRISENTKMAHPEIDWFKISGFRNVLVHDYLGVDMEMVWNIIENDLPKLKQSVEKMLEEQK